jgi:hypothetical protein
LGNSIRRMRVIQDIQKFIQHTMDTQAIDRWHPVQVEVDSDKTREFMEYLISVSDVVNLQELTGMQRQSTDKSQEFILSQIDSYSMAGIKVNHLPMYDFHEYDKWEGGYIEGFLRTMTNVDYFIWTYTKMEHLEDIVTKFQHSLRY